MDLTRLALRPVAADDLSLLQVLSGPAAAGFNWSGFGPEAALRDRFARDGFLGPDDGWLVVAGPEAALLGSVGWRSMHWSTPPWSRAWHIGLTILPEHRGQGVGTRAQQLLCDYLFSTTGVNRLEAVTNAANVHEQRALLSAGFVQEGVLRRAELRQGSWQDLLLYSRLREEWVAPGQGA